MGGPLEIKENRVAWATVGITVLMIVLSWYAQQAVTTSQIQDLKGIVKDIQTQQQTAIETPDAKLKIALLPRQRTGSTWITA